MNDNVMDHGDWLRRQEAIAASPALVADVGVGLDIQTVTGLSPKQVAELVRPILNDLVDGGCNCGDFTLRDERVHFYIRRRKKHVDVGTRKDFTDLGWAAMCDELDRQLKERK